MASVKKPWSFFTLSNGILRRRETSLYIQKTGEVFPTITFQKGIMLSLVRINTFMALHYRYVEELQRELLCIGVS